MRAHAYVRACVPVRDCVCVPTHVYDFRGQVYLRVCLRVRVCVRAYALVPARACVRVYTRVCVHASTCDCGVHA
jgi:hypothetical protein